MQYWRIRSNPEELENQTHSEKVEKCLNKNKIFIGFPDTLKKFKEEISIGDYFVTRDEDKKSYIGKITSDWQDVSIQNLHYRKVEWLNNKNPVNNTSQFWGRGYVRTCTEITGDDVTRFRRLIERIL